MEDLENKLDEAASSPWDRFPAPYLPFEPVPGEVCRFIGDSMDAHFPELSGPSGLEKLQWLKRAAVLTVGHIVAGLGRRDWPLGGLHFVSQAGFANLSGKPSSAATSKLVAQLGQACIIVRVAGRPHRGHATEYRLSKGVQRAWRSGRSSARFLGWDDYLAGRLYLGPLPAWDLRVSEGLVEG